MNFIKAIIYGERLLDSYQEVNESRFFNAIIVALTNAELSPLRHSQATSGRVGALSLD